MEHDVLIIGAGPTGAIAAKRLAEEGYRVLVLEQGDWPDYSKATVHRRTSRSPRGATGAGIRTCARRPATIPSTTPSPTSRR